MDRVLADHLAFVDGMDRWFASMPPSYAERYSQFILFARFTAKIKMLRGSHRDIVRWRSTYPETNAHIWSFSNIPYVYRLCFLLADRLPLWMVKRSNRRGEDFTHLKNSSIACFGLIK